MKFFNNLENKTSSDTYWRVQLVCKKGWANSSLKPPLKYNQDRCFWQIKVLTTLLTIWWVREISCSFRYYEVSDPLNRERYSRFTFVENTIGNLPIVPRATFLGSDFMNSFVLLVYACLAASRTLCNDY